MDSDFPLRMTPAEAELFSGQLASASVYLEYGCGGSTLAAVKSKLQNIVSVDTDLSWIERLKQNNEIATALNTGRLVFRPIDVGVIGDWGAPTNQKKIRNWPRYAVDPFISTDFDFDLILVDGRFRVHCLIAAAMCAAPHTLIFLHNYKFRHQYTIADKYFISVHRVESAALFRKKADLNYRSLYIDLIVSLFDSQ